MISDISQLTASSRTGAMWRVLSFLTCYPGFHALGALGLDPESADDMEAVLLLIVRGWVGEINGMIGVTTEGSTAYLAMRRRAAEKACSKEAELASVPGRA